MTTFLNLEEKIWVIDQTLRMRTVGKINDKKVSIKIVGNTPLVIEMKCKDWEVRYVADEPDEHGIKRGVRAATAEIVRGDYAVFVVDYVMHKLKQ